VDDSDLVRGFVKDLLADAPHQLLEARSAAAALKIAENPGRQIDLLISDLLLPGPSGLDLARKLRVERPHLKVLLLSADPANAIAATLLPNAHFLEKTQIVVELANAVKQILAENPHSGF
jgi:two-component system cell cycle sensor histidine kinase/response regulator CckA